MDKIGSLGSLSPTPLDQILMKIPCWLAATAIAFANCLPAAAASLKVVLNEIHYHPADDSTAGELVELHNHGVDPADLSGWVLEGGIHFVFPAGTTLEPDGYLVVAASPATIVSRYSLDPGIVLGPFEGVLSNGGEDLELRTPDDYVVSFAHYRDSEPWPESPDGEGPSLERISPLREEHDAEAWAPSVVVGGTPGAPNSSRVEDPAPPPSGAVLVPQGSVWKYFKGTANPPAGWNTASFIDAAWLSGAAGFGYDDGDDATVLNDMQGGYSTLFVRRVFTLSDAAAVQTLSLAVSYDDGYVAYLNGVEVDRINVNGTSGSAVAFNATASGFVEPAPTRTVDLNSRRDLLVQGNNVLALIGVNRAIDNADFSLHPSLTGTIQTGQQQAVSYIAAGGLWRFFRGLTAPPQTWRDLSFVDDSWEEGSAGFGYGDNDDATVLSDMQNNYVTVLIRRRFQVADASKVTSLTLSVSYDDGFVAYLNGVQVASANVSQSGYDQPSDGSHEAGAPEEFTISAPSSLLRTGVNVLAIEGHNSDLPSTDFSLSPALDGEIATDDGGPLPGTPPARPPRDVVLNEVAETAAGSGWVELFNTTNAAIDVGGRTISLFPATAGSFAIPASTSIPGRGRLVINEPQLGFALANAAVVIFSTSDNRFIDSLNPRTAPSGMSTGRWPDGSENRYVFSTPTKNAANAITLESRVVINEIQYHPGDTNTGGEFIELHNRGAQSVDVSGWSFTRGVEYTFPQGTSIAAGGFLVIAHDPTAAQAFYGIPFPLGPYSGQLKNAAETILLRDTLKNTVDRVRYADEGGWPEAADGDGPSLELVHPALENRWGPAWRASTGNGTPAAANSARVNDPNPIVAGVEHFPVVPTPSDEVRVTAAVSDERGITSATLFWRADGAAGNPTQVAMADDGVNDDGIAGNGIYGAQIPARPDRTVVLCWIEAQAQGGATVTWPPAAPQPAFLYQVEAARPEQVRPTYRVVMTAADLQTLRTRSVNSDTLLNCAFVSRGKSHQFRGIRYRGSSARSCDPLSYRIQFDHDVDLDGMKDLNLNGCNAQRQWIGLDFLSRTGLPTAQSWFRKLSMNGTLQAEVYLRVEAIEEEFIERTLPAADEGGNIYRGVNQANLDYRGESFAPYQNDYEKHSNTTDADWSDIVDLCFRFDPDTTSDADFPAAIEQVVDVEEWALFFAAFAILGSTENSILLNNGDDYFLYHRPSDGKWMLLPWDLDSCFDEATQTLFRPSVAQVRRFLTHPRYAPSYWCHVEALLGAALRPDIVEARIDNIAPLFSAGRITQLRGFEPARRAYIEPRISPSLTVTLTSGGALCGDEIVTTGGTLSLSGLAPTCGTTEVRLDGKAVTYNQLDGQWSGSVTIAGARTIPVTAVDRAGVVVAARVLNARPPVQGTQLPANVTTSRTLTKAQSPHVVDGAVTVGVAATLTIEAGALLLLDQNASLTINGKLVAEGTAAEPVRIESAGCGGSKEGIVLAGTGAGSRLLHCAVKGLRGAPGRSAGISIEGPVVAILDSTITVPPGGTGLEVRSGASLAFEDSVLQDGFNGLVFSGGNGTLRRSQLRKSSGAALTLTGGSGGIVETCLFVDAGTGIAATERASLIIEHLTLYRCGIGLDARENSGGTGAGSIDAHSLIIWATTVSVAEDAGQPVKVSFSNLSGTGIRPGTGNINGDPRFLDTVASDFHLKFTSPCRGTGKDGTDMGAFAYISTGETNRFLRCDTNSDGEHDIADAVFSLFRLFAGGLPANCESALDCNSDAKSDVSDVIFSLNHLFTSGPKPQGAYPACEARPVEECGQSTCID